MKVAAALVFAAVVMIVQGEDGVILCGRQLADARVLICYGAEYVDKRSSIPLDSLISHIGDGERWLENPSLPWTGRRGALSARWSRNKRIIGGLVDECCLKPCTPEEIINYC